MEKKFTIIYSMPSTPVETSLSSEGEVKFATTGKDPRDRIAVVYVTSDLYERAVAKGALEIYNENAPNMKFEDIVPVASFHGHLDNLEHGLPPYLTDRRFVEMAGEFLGKMRAGYEIGYGFHENNIMRRPCFMMRENGKVVHSLGAPNGFKSYDLLPWPLRKLVDEYVQFNSDVTPLEPLAIGTPLGAMIIKSDDLTDEGALDALRLQVRALERRHNVTGEFDWDAVERFERSGLNFLRIEGIVIALNEPDDGFEGVVSQGEA